MLNTEDETVSRVDPETGEVAGTVRSPGRADRHRGRRRARSGSARAPGATSTTRRGSRGSIPRPERSRGSSSCRTRRTAAVRGPTSGFPRVAVGDGARMGHQPRRDHLAHRSGDGAARGEGAHAGVGARTLAAGDGRVGARLTRTRWCGSTRARTGSPSPRSSWAATSCRGSRSAAARCGPARRRASCGGSSQARGRSTRTIEVGAGVQYVAFGDGAVWAANWERRHGRADRPGHQRRDRADPGRRDAGARRRRRVGVGESRGTARAMERCPPRPAARSSREAGRRTSSSHPTCRSRVVSPRSTPRTRDAVQFVIEDHGFRAGDHVVGFQSCDDSTAQTGVYDHVVARRTRRRSPARRGSSPWSARTPHSARRSRCRSRTAQPAGRSPSSALRPRLRTSRAAASWRCLPRSASAASPRCTTRRASATSSAWWRAATSTVLRSPSSRGTSTWAASTCSTTGRTASATCCSRTGSSARRRTWASASPGVEAAGDRRATPSWPSASRSRAPTGCCCGTFLDVAAARGAARATGPPRRAAGGRNLPPPPPSWRPRAGRPRASMSPARS